MKDPLESYYHQHKPSEFFPLTQTTWTEGNYRPRISFWKDVAYRFSQNSLAMASLGFLILMVLFALIAPVLSQHTYYDTHLNLRNRPPSMAFLFGTDELGRDILVRIWYGARISLLVGVCAAFIDLLIGVIWGGCAGFFGGKIDELLMRIADVLYAIPQLLKVIMFTVIIGPGFFTLIIAMAFAGWVNMARIVRGQILQLKKQEFVLAAVAMGASPLRILVYHLLPNAIGPIIVTVTLTIPTAIFTEAFLSFIGLGVPLPLASWGTMASEGLPALKYYPWRLFFPAVFISLTMLALNLLGDGLRDSLDPRLRK